MSAREHRTYRILIIEDNQGDVTLLREALRWAKLPCEIVAFSDGEAALRHIREVANSENIPRPDAVLLDMHLPRLDATQALEAMRSSPLLTNTPVIVLSSAISNDDRKRIQPFQVARHLVKPSNLDEFLKIGEMVRDILMVSEDRQPEDD